MNEETHVSEQSQADVDEEVGTASCDHEDADRRDCEPSANGAYGRVPSQHEAIASYRGL